jgi:hypothetical protein
MSWYAPESHIEFLSEYLFVSSIHPYDGLARDDDEEIIGHLLLRMNEKRDCSNRLIDGLICSDRLLRVNLFLSIDDTWTNGGISRFKWQ